MRIGPREREGPAKEELSIRRLTLGRLFISLSDAFAEAQALEEVINVVEEITDLTRALFGSSTFFQDQREDKNRSPASPADP